MNTNTVGQAIRLDKDFGIMIFTSNTWIYDTQEWEEEPSEFLSDEQPYVTCNRYAQVTTAQKLGPALTLDELHKIFVFLSQRDGSRVCFPVPFFTWTGDKQLLWTTHIITPKGLVVEGSFHYSNLTDNHAEDWTAILIWLLEEGHVSAEQVNDILKGE